MNIKEIYVELLKEASKSYCYRKKVGCVVTDKDDNILNINHNKPHHSIDICTIKNCKNTIKIGKCKCIHSEINAIEENRLRIIQPRGRYERTRDKFVANIHNMYVNLQPCFYCTAYICVNSVCRNVYFSEYYGIDSKDNIEVFLNLDINVFFYNIEKDKVVRLDNFRKRNRV